MKMQKAVRAAEDEIACHNSGIGSITSRVDVKKAFDDQSLSDIEKEYFACAVAKEDGNYIQQFLARYPPDPSAVPNNYRPYVQSESPLTLTLWMCWALDLLD